MSDITMNAEEYLDMLRELNERLWEEVLDTITDHFSKTITDNDDYMKYYCTCVEGDTITLELVVSELGLMEEEE
jgi:hypothetical protein